MLSHWRIEFADVIMEKDENERTCRNACIDFGVGCLCLVIADRIEVF
jgi:hypothetical protein